VKVEVRLFATLAAFLPPGSRDDALLIEVPEGSTVRDVSRVLGMPPDLARVSLVNGHDRDLDRPLSDQDVVSLFPPLAGGHR
jgi:molybdopterin converting factor small subunit